MMLVKNKKDEDGQSCQVSAYVCMYVSTTMFCCHFSFCFAVTFVFDFFAKLLLCKATCEWFLLVGLQVMGTTEFG